MDVIMNIATGISLVLMLGLLVSSIATANEMDDL